MNKALLLSLAFFAVLAINQGSGQAQMGPRPSLPQNTNASIRLERYLVDETHSNGSHYRQQIADAKVLVEEVNGWLPANNPYGASVALEQVEARDGVSPAGGMFSLRYAGVAPWTVTLIDLRAD